MGFGWDFLTELTWAIIGLSADYWLVSGEQDKIMDPEECEW